MVYLKIEAALRSDVHVSVPVLLETAGVSMTLVWTNSDWFRDISPNSPELIEPPKEIKRTSVHVVTKVRCLWMIRQATDRLSHSGECQCWAAEPALPKFLTLRS